MKSIFGCCILNFILIILSETLAKVRQKDLKKVTENNYSSLPDGSSMIESMNLTSLLKLNSLKSRADFAMYLGVVLQGANEAEVFTRVGTATSGAQVEPVEAVPAGCTPIQTLVTLPLSADPEYINFPSCVLLERCGGCCYGNRLSCQPETVEKVMLKVTQIAAMVQTSGRNSRMTAEKVTMINEERHTKCACQCKTQEKDCDAKLQTYNPSECTCICTDQNAKKNCEAKGSTHYWDTNKCSCLCRHVLDCSTGQIFEHTDCRCKSSMSLRTMELSILNG